MYLYVYVYLVIPTINIIVNIVKNCESAYTYSAYFLEIRSIIYGRLQSAQYRYTDFK